MPNKVPYIEQMESSECGLACFAMILGYYHHHTTLHELRKYYDTSKAGLSFSNLKKVAEAYQLEAKTYHIEPEKWDMIQDEPIFPVIAHWEWNHYVVIESMKKNKVTIVDPSFGRKKITMDELKQKATGYMMSFHGGEKLPKKKKPTYLTLLLPFAFEHKKHLGFLLAVTLILIVTSLAVPFTTKWVTDHILVPKNIEWAHMLGVFIAGILTSYFLFSLIRGYIVARFQKLLDTSLMTHFMDHLFHLAYPFFETRSKGDLLYRANSNVQIREILSSRLIGIFVDSALIVTLAAALLSQSFRLGSIVIGLSLLILLLLLFSTSITRNFTNKQVMAQTKTQSVLAEHLDLMPDIKAMGIENKAYKEWLNKFNDQVAISEKSNRWTSWLDSFSSSIQFGAPLFILWVGSFQVISGQMTMGTLFSISAMAGMYLMPIVSMGSGYMQIIFLSSILQRLYDVLVQQREREGKQIPERSQAIESIAFHHVSFKYGKFEKERLSDVSFEIKKGEKIGISGPSGSGKSTLIKLLIGLYEPTQGEILYNQIPYDHIQKSFLKKNIGVVLQESKLFNKSVLFNITMGMENASIDKVIQSAKAAQIHDDIMQLPMQYETILNEGGSNFSGGQRQRLMIARALFKEPAILVLDEATSALDQETENNLIDHLNRLIPTQVVISHRPSVLEKMDKILKIEDGKKGTLTHPALQRSKIRIDDRA